MSGKNPLGQATVYPEQYSPDLLYAIARIDARGALGIDAEPPFRGVDIWNAWDLTWLDPDGLPRVGTAEFHVPADSANLVESKSLKLYLWSFRDEGHFHEAGVDPGGVQLPSSGGSSFIGTGPARSTASTQSRNGPSPRSA